MAPYRFSGKLYLIPTTLGENDPMEVLPLTVKNLIGKIDHYIVENEKTARRFIKQIDPAKKQPDLHLSTLNKHTDPTAHSQMLLPCETGVDVGLMSEAGCPAVADPGAAIVNLAHEKGIRIVPLVGPSSILLAVMASGLSGQNFAFNGYLPIDKNDRKSAIKNLERISLERSQSQLFIETPYRNNKMLEDLISTLHPSTKLCVAADITLPDEYIRTFAVDRWKKEKPDLQNRPCIFIIQKFS